jgi:hypothetical protein
VGGRGLVIENEEHGTTRISSSLDGGLKVS